MRTFVALLVVLTPGCACGESHEPRHDAAVITDAGSDAFTPPDVTRADSGPRCVIDDTIPMEPSGCCERANQRCTQDCGSFVVFCVEGCCLFTGP